MMNCKEFNLFLVSESTPKRCIFLHSGASNKKCKILLFNLLQHFASSYKVISGDWGIRTLDTLLRYTHFPGVLLQPLGQVSNKGLQKYIFRGQIQNKFLLSPQKNTRNNSGCSQSHLQQKFNWSHVCRMALSAYNQWHTEQNHSTSYSFG